jgi:hypothetical protein
MRADDVCDILDRHNAVDVDERVKNWRDRGWSGYRQDASPFSDDELRTERSYYGSSTGGTLTGESGIGVDRERARLHDDRDDLTPPVGTTRRSNEAGDIGTSGVIGTTGMTSAGLGTRGAGHSTPDVTSDRSTSGTWADTTHGARDIDDRGVMERAGDKMREWKEDVKDTARDLRDEARDNDRAMRDYNAESRDNRPGTSAWADETRGDFGSVDTRYSGSDTTRDTGSAMRDAGREMKRDVKEMGRDTSDVLHGRTGTQPHDIAEERREAERRRRARVYDRTIL